MALFLPFAIVVVIIGVFRLLYMYFYHPLASIPNSSRLAPISRLLWEFTNEYRGRITLELPKLHQELGPLIRIGPNQVSLYSIEIYKAVYASASTFVKDPRVYSQFVQDQHPALFSLTDHKEHAQRRRHMGILFNRSRIQALEPMMLEEISRFLSVLEHLRKQKTVDLVLTCRALEADIVSRFAFGSAIGALDAVSDGELHSIVRENDERSSRMAIDTTFPRTMMLWISVEKVLFNIFGWQTAYTSNMKKFEKWANQQLECNMDAEKASPLSFLKVMAGARISPESALSEAKEMLGPGTDTTSATLAHILWALSLHQQFQNELVADLEAAGWPTDMSALEAISRLTAAVKEGIRWTGAAAAMLPRIVPPGGVTLAGKYLPGGTMIASSPIWYLRDRVAFPEPEKYRPGRWLVSERSESTFLRDQYYIPFSKGSSTCIGIHFAYLELYLSVSQILKKYKIVAPYDLDGVSSSEADLPPRLEWVAAVPTVKLEVCLVSRV